MKIPECTHGYLHPVCARTRSIPRLLLLILVLDIYHTQIQGPPSLTALSRPFFTREHTPEPASCSAFHKQ